MEGELCSTCELFTSKEYSFLPVGRIVCSGGIESIVEYYKSLEAEYINALNDMFVLDAVIYNTDRHFGNFGFLVDNKTNKIVAPAPLFDHGNSLFNFAGRDDLDQIKRSLLTLARYCLAYTMILSVQQKMCLRQNTMKVFDVC